MINDIVPCYNKRAYKNILLAYNKNYIISIYLKVLLEI